QKPFRTKPNINVTPLIDVLLVLLIIFMAISPVKPHKYETKVPEKTDQPNTEPDLALVVSVSPERGYALNQTKAETLADLNSLLHQALDQRPPDRKTVFIKGAPTLRYSEVAEVIDTVKASGAAPIGLQLEGLN
ncbi:MAG TPA: biopolymer transporter ExbD, partial [Blastocatellia bacterium]|nr:biopolymer transporter ExbD [Blastocatellia bacterium]